MADESDSGGFSGQRRFPFKDLKIDEITQNDIKVRFAGIIVEKSGDTLLVDDGSGQIKVMAEDASGFDANDKVRVFGRVIPIEDGAEISAEFIQDFNEVNMEKYFSLMASERKLGI